MSDGLRLFFLRHGPADRDQYDGEDDDLRPLVPEGRERMRITAEAVARLAPKLEVVVTSPLLRAAQTAEIVARRLGLLEAMREDERLGPGFDLEALASILAGLKDDHRRILLVGHEPDFSTVVGDLTGGVVVVRKGALARVDLTPGEKRRGCLVWLLQPRVLLHFAGSDEAGESDED